MYNEKKMSQKIKLFGMFAFIPLLAFIAVVILPFILGIIMTFTNTTALGLSFEFIGLEHWRVAFSDSNFWNSLGITFQYTIYTFILTNIVAFALAMLVTSGLKGQNFFRVGFFTPNLIGGLILGYIWQFIFIRILPFLGESLNLEIFSSSWLSDPNRALWTLIIVGVWQGSGYLMLIYTAGLMGIPKSLVEAAELDGAGFWQKLIRIKMPLMAPAFTICLFLSLRGGFMIYDLNLALTEGGPFRSTQMVSMQIFDVAFIQRNFGAAQVQSLMLFVIVAIVAIIQVKVMKKKELES